MERGMEVPLFRGAANAASTCHRVSEKRRCPPHSYEVEVKRPLDFLFFS